MKIRNALQDHGRAICFGLAIVLALILTQQTGANSIWPSVDGQGYAIRGFSLYGFLHSGQLSRFGDLLCRPNQSICPPHYLLFFAMPQMFAGTAAYIFSQNLVVYLLLAAGIFQLCQVLNRKEWAPAVFLICAVNNPALTDYLYFYLDMEFFSVAMCVVALQLTAWRHPGARQSIVSGIMLSLLFWTKPANALVFIAIFALSEIFRAALNVLVCKTPADRRQSFFASLRHWGFQSLGFLPLLGMAIYCGGFQSILLLIETNELANTTTPLDCGTLLRLFYFPLCLAFFYHVLLLGGILLVVLLIGRRWKPIEKQSGDFASHFFIPLALAYLAWGLLFSFEIQSKTIRSLLPMLPLFWIALCLLIERRRLRVDLMFLVAGIYTLVLFSQKSFDLLGTRNSYVDNTYQLTSGSWVEMPSPWALGSTLNTGISEGIRQHRPPPGIICVSSIELQKSLAWGLNKDDMLLGKAPDYDVHIILNYKANYLNRTFTGARLIAFKVLQGPQAKSPGYIEILKMIQYGSSEWVTKQHCAEPGVFTGNDSSSEPLGYMFLFPTPLTQAQVDLANRSEPFSMMVQEDDDGSVPVSGHHFTREEGWKLIKAWYDKKIGKIP